MNAGLQGEWPVTVCLDHCTVQRRTLAEKFFVCFPLGRRPMLTVPHTQTRKLHRTTEIRKKKLLHPLRALFQNFFAPKIFSGRFNATEIRRSACRSSRKVPEYQNASVETVTVKGASQTCETRKRYAYCNAYSGTRLSRGY